MNEAAGLEQVRFSALSLSDLMAREFGPTQWLVEGLIPEAGITVLSGDPGSFKTWIYLTIARDIAAGQPFLGKFPTKQANVLIIDEENGESELQRRFRLLDSDPNLPIQVASYGGFKLTPDAVTELMVYCTEHQIKLIIFDPFIRVSTSPDENDATKMAEVTRQLQRFLDIGITVLVVHHHRKPSHGQAISGHEMRGSSEIFAATHSQLAVSRNKLAQRLTIYQTKSRVGKERDPFVVKTPPEDAWSDLIYEGAVVLVSKPDEAREAILGFLTNTTELLNVETIEATIKANGYKLGDSVVRQTLNLLVDEKIVDYKTVKSGKRLYGLYPVNVDPVEQQTEAITDL